jgi:HTH-type transcriptional regulator / antitoxin HigA
MVFKVIKTREEHEQALAEAERLVALDPEDGTSEAERLELLALLIEDFEKRTFSFPAVDPIEFIEFRMEEQGLRQKDLVQILGSRSRVSEVLGRKRPLTVQMIRSLSTDLGIPADLLIGKKRDDVRSSATSTDLDWTKFPYAEMDRRGWFASVQKRAKSAEDALRAFLAEVMPTRAAQVMYRRRFKGEELDDRAYYSTLAWTARVLMRAKTVRLPKGSFEANRITVETLRDLARLSWFRDGPKLALEFLANLGIATVVEPRLPNAVLDGAALLSEQRVPVIGLTLRIDRVDNFWFTLLHECAHVWKHLESPDEAFIDRLDGSEGGSIKEREANRVARDAFISRATWERSEARKAPTRENIQQLADSLHIHPAIVVGRLQYETGSYEIFRDLLGQSTVRKHFADVTFG